MEQVLIAGTNDPLHNTDTEYNTLIGFWHWYATEDQRSKLVGTSGKIKNLRFKLNGSPGAGKSYDFTLMVNGVPSALTVHIHDLDTSGTDTTHEVDVVGGDSVSLRCAPTNTPTSRDATWTSMFEGAIEKESLILGSSAATTDKVDTEYGYVMGGDVFRLDEDSSRQVCPTSGTIKNLYVRLNIDPGTAPDAYRFTLRKNGISQALTVTIVANDTTGNDTDHEVTVAAGDVLTMMIEPISTPSEEPSATYGMVFVADADGESIIMGNTMYQALDTGVLKYAALQCSVNLIWQADESTVYALGQECILKKLYVLLSAAPGDGKSYTFNPRIAIATGDLSVTITGAAVTTGNDTINTDAVADDDYLSLMCTPAGTPAAAVPYWGLVSYIAPPPVEYTKTLTESLGLVDAVSKGVELHPLVEPLGLSDTVVKEPGKMLKESLGLVDVYSRTWSVYRTYDELLGLADTVTKGVSLPLSEILGLLDTVIKSASIISRVFGPGRPYF